MACSPPTGKTARSRWVGALRSRARTFAGRHGWGPAGWAASLPVAERDAARLPLNCLCHPDAWADGEWRLYSRALGIAQDEGWYHRKAWEWTQCIYGLERLGVLGPRTLALGVGAGHERVLYYLANRTALTIATDLYSGGFTGTSAAEADPTFLTHPERFAPFIYDKSHLVACFPLTAARSLSLTTPSTSSTP